MTMDQPAPQPAPQPAFPARPPGTAEAARLFDALGKTYEDTYSGNPAQLAAIDWLLARLPERARVMDIGSGTGRPTAALITAAGHDVTGYDVSKTMTELARAQVPRARFEQADVRTLPETPGQWDAITAFFPLLQMPRADLDATLARIARWLAPGGLLAFATVPSDIEDQEIRWMGRTLRCTSYPAETYGRLLREAGLDVVHEHLDTFHPDFPGAPPEEHLFIHARKPGGPAVTPHALAGPYPLPAVYRGPHELSEQGWLNMEARFERHDIALVVDALARNTRVLDVGGGTGAVVREIAARLGSVTTVEPHAAREESMRHLAVDGVTVLPGRAERLPLRDARFDAAVATWVLHYTDDPEAAVAEMARTVDRAHPEARIVLVQGAPDNELVDLWNRTCAPLVGEPRDHQGHLLTLAARTLAGHGFDDISFTRARVDVVFPEVGAEAKAQAAAEVLAGFWNTGHPRLDRLHEALLPTLRDHFATGTDRFNDDAVMLVARPSASATAGRR
ncbi:methyltransferase domain-containing protein [Streptomyces sp. I05A-00742]|uniref:methyltransferase domain-containing protein n=1 Tax=Streptomyces sp. I05A-00742 TaxID=2732853 RepID=UPI00148842AB|nr:methyltransferase domain-containing protein [Streptomyces sp. I05A-00742]